MGDIEASSDIANGARTRVQRDPQLTGGRFVAMSGGSEEIIPKVMYRFREKTADGSTVVTLTLYIGVRALGAALWQQEVGVLERVGGLANRSLPTILDSGYLEEDFEGPGVTFIRTRAGEATVDETGDSSHFARVMHSRPAEAIRLLWMLADALVVIHDCRIVHRNVTPAAIESELVGDAATSDDIDVQFRGLRLQLTRFEMSGMLSNLLRSRREGRAGPDDVRAFMLAQTPRSRVFAAPERLRFMFADEQLGAQDFSGDVFGLGMIGVEWFLGPQEMGGEADYRDLASLLALQARIRSSVAASDLPVELRRLLLDMIGQSVPRPTATDVVVELGRAYEASLLLPDSADSPPMPYLVSFQPGSNRSDKTLYKWGHLSTSTDEKDGVEELRVLLEEDMKGGRVMFSPDGAEPFVFDDNPSVSSKAKTVIEGKEFIWFLNRMFKPQALGPPKHYDEIQIVRYVIERSRMTRLLQVFLTTRLSRRLPAVTAINFNDAKAIHDERVVGRPSWTPLIASLDFAPPSPKGLIARQRAMEWYVEYQRASLRAREYAYVVVNTSVPGRPQITLDDEAESARRQSTTDSLLRYLLSDPDRPTLRDFILSAQEDLGTVKVRLSASGAHLGRGTPVRVESVRDRQIVLDASSAIPTHGWLRLDADGPTDSQLQNQQNAIVELASRHDLLAQLASPRSKPRNGDRWGEDASGSLVGEGAQVVRDMLAHETLFVLQGPPGTGKTTITSQAVAHFLRREKGARVLVSAQSHDALDNLAERILDRLELTTNGSNGLHTALRIVSRHRHDAVSKRMQSFIEAQAVEDLTASIRTRAQQTLAAAHARSSELGATIEEWIDLVDRLGLDLTMRLRRGANLVFATTGAATALNLVTRGSAEPFDWVVIEEAARAWPSELALPMNRGNRWTLIGDQAQIGAFGRPNIDRLLESFESDEDPELKALFARRDELTSNFDLFGSFFDDDSEQSWRRTLRQQYRMDDRVAEIVSTTFYKKSQGLESPSGRRPHGLVHPSWVADEAIVWIDTGARKRAVRGWSNDAEAANVAAIVRRLSPELEKKGRTIAVLTPYREQMKRLEGTLGEKTQIIYTIDGFQGREADVIVVSLVRDSVIDPARESSNVGHVADPGRANVLMSRARSLLVIVGNLELYENHAGAQWNEMVATVRRKGAILSLAEAELE